MPENHLKTREKLMSVIVDSAKVKAQTGERLIVGIAGAPAAGKSTLAQELCTAINDQYGASEQLLAAVVPMDGYHFDNAILDARGHRSRKGAPHTFDVAGFAQILRRLRDNDQDVVIPEFDRQLDLARAGAAVVSSQHNILLVEGNYLLLDQAPWCDLAQYFDLSVFLQVPVAVLEQRLIQRWIEHGADYQAAKARALLNDIPNAELVVQASKEADYILCD